MKKIATLTIVLLLLFSMAMPVFADLGDSDFDNWSVVTGPSGFSFVDVPYYDTPENADLHDYLKPGTKLWVHSYDTESKKYLLTIDGESGHKIKGAGHVLVTEAQLDKYFVGEKEAYSPKYTTKLDKKVECVVTPSVGVVLRQGPGTGYPSFKVIPQNTKLTYRYVYEGEKYNWGYVTYKGQDGWCCIDYTKEIVTTTEATTETTTETTEVTTDATTESTTEATTEATTTEPASESTNAPIISLDTADPGLATEPAGEPDSTGFFGSTKNVILACCAGAVILALTAAVVLMIVKKKKNN